MKWFWCFALLLGGSAAGAGLAVIRTSDGRNLSGELQLADGRLTLTPTNSPASTLAFSEITQGRFNLTNIPTATTNLVLSSDGSLPAPWKAQDIGATGAPGSATFRDGVFTLMGAGDSLSSSPSDSFFLVYRPLDGDVQITARILSSRARAAGVMIREAAAPHALFAAMLYESGDMLVYRSRRGEQFRQQFQREGDGHSRNYVSLPRWVRLKREGKELKGYISPDNGEHWENFYRGSVEMGTNVLAGLFLLSGDNTKPAEAKFDNVALIEGSANNPSSPGAPSRVSVVLRDGTSVVAEIISADDSTVKLRRQGKALSLSTPHVGRILFQKLSLPAELIPNRPGLLLDRNDFVDGEFAGIEKGEIKLNSVLFGVRRYKPGAQVKALILREVVLLAAACEVKTIDGCVWEATTARLQHEELLLDVPVIGPIKVPWAEVSEVTRRSVEKD